MIGLAGSNGRMQGRRHVCRKLDRDRSRQWAVAEEGMMGCGKQARRGSLCEET